MGAWTKRLLLIVTALLLAYTLAGFFLLPPLARHLAVKLASEDFGLELEIRKLDFNPFSFETEIRDLRVRDGSSPLLRFARLYLNFETRSLLEKAVLFEAIELAEPWVHLALAEDGRLNLLEIAERRPSPTVGGEPAGGAWPLVVRRMGLQRGSVRVTDRKHSKDFDATLAPIAFEVREFSTLPAQNSLLRGFEIGIEGGRLRISGDFSTIPAALTAQFEIADVPLSLAQPYLDPRLAVRVDSGRLRFSGRLRYGTTEQGNDFELLGNAAVAQLAVKDAAGTETLARLNDLAINGLKLTLKPDTLHIEEVVLSEPATVLRILPTGETNFSALARTGSADAAPSPAAGEPDGAGFPVSVERIRFAGGTVDFFDTQIEPDFRAVITNLSGQIEHLSTDPAGESQISLEGQIEAQGKAQITGSLAPLRVKDKLAAIVAFRNIELTTFSPYAGKFAGYRIRKGKLFLDLDYTLENGLIRGANRILLDHFELGEAVESKDAPSLPLKLAVSLLKDRNGKIEIDLPVQGDVNTPDFSIGPLIGRALRNAITKIVTAPFAFLGSLFGGGKDMEFARFEPASASLPAAESKKMLQLAKAMSERPQLRLDIQGYADPEVDATRIREQRLTDKLRAVSADPKLGERDRLRAVYRATQGEAALAALEQRFTSEPAPKTDPDSSAAPFLPAPGATFAPPTLGEDAFYAAMREELLAAQTVREDDLRKLALERAQAAMDVLVESGGVNAERIFVRGGEIAGPAEGLRAQMILGAN